MTDGVAPPLRLLRFAHSVACCGGFGRCPVLVRDLSAEELRWATADPGLRSEVITAIRELEGGILKDEHLY